MKTSRLFSAIAAAVLLIAGCAKAPTSVSVNPTSLSLTEGESAVLVATVLPENAKYGSIQWTSSDEKVATVSDGRVMAVGAGTATVKATAEGVSGTATVSVKAKYIPVEKVNVTDQTGADRGVLNVGETVQLKAQVLPANATEQGVTWSSTTDCATVSSTGLVTAVSLGDCVIRAHTKDGIF
ncbi:MAG: Ig-like domain-containing protein, partial [Bacteroidales bacterium]|nr:Ig-like domain-containing protein [Bacteroidales bacterium]